MSSTADWVPQTVTGIALEGVRSRPRLIVVSGSSEASPSDGARRALNVLVAAAALLLVAPLMAVIALAVKLSSPGPVFFRQVRVGIDRRQGTGGHHWRRRIDYGGRLFTMYKFRTMYLRPGHEDEQVWARPDDPRVTRVGRVLRKYRLDELPQLFNVLRGDMNVVGPRPEQPEIFMRLREQIGQYQLRQRLLPGITGWAQIKQEYDSDVDSVQRKLALDLEYASRSSALEDFTIMLRTFPVMVLGKGAW